MDMKINFLYMTKHHLSLWSYGQYLGMLQTFEVLFDKDLHAVALGESHWELLTTRLGEREDF